MELKGEQTLLLPREQVWAALNDPEILRQCVPGCEAFEPIAENEYKVVMTAAVGPVKARFNGALTLSDIQPPASYRLAFTGSGGAAGFGKGSAQVDLTSVEGGTTLRYAVNAQVGGKLAQVGARLIDGVAKKMADEFFNRFSKVLAPAAAGVDAPSTGAATPSATSASAQSAVPTAAVSAASPSSGVARPALSAPSTHTSALPAARWVWSAIGVLALVVVYLLMRH